MKTRKLIIFLIRKRLGLKKFQGFRFAEQKSPDNWYFFGDEFLWKVIPGYHQYLTLSNVSLNWLLNEKCKINKIGIKCDAFNEIERVAYGEEKN